MTVSLSHVPRRAGREPRRNTLVDVRVRKLVLHGCFKIVKAGLRQVAGCAYGDLVQHSYGKQDEALCVMKSSRRSMSFLELSP
jgi:hypothetical protein